MGASDGGVVGAAAAGCGSPRTPASFPSDFIVVGGNLFFSASDGVHGAELWKSAGTTARPVLVKDINPGARNGRSGPSYLTAVDGELFFTADDGRHGAELWKSDGTKAGTVLVKDINPGPGGDYDSGPSYLTDVAGTLFFTTDDGTHGAELWKSDGTRAGTVLVKDIRPGRRGEYGPRELTDVAGTLFFTTDDGSHDDELWKSDGTKAGTVLVKDTDPAPRGDYEYGPRDLTDVAGTLFFATDDGSHGNELWKSDGTEAGTVLVKDIHPDVYDSTPYSLTRVGGRLFFSAQDGVHGRELWKSDGTEAGTVLVKDIRPVARSADPASLTAVDGNLFFFADDGSHGRELWMSDGAEANTVLVKDINPGAGDSSAGYDAYDDQAAVGGTLFFPANDGSHGTELWTSDGTEANTVLVKDIRSGAGGADPTYLTEVGGHLVFAARDGVHGFEPWTSDGTEAGTVLVEDVNKGGAFTVARRGTRNFTKGTLRRKVTVAGAGRLVVGPVGGSLIRRSRHDMLAAGATTVTLKPTRAGMRKLRQSLRRAHRNGGSVGRLGVKARFTFTPCGGTPSSVVRRYTLKIK